ncbi:hypothetical protein JJL45_12370 [Tamlana sp. s12]|uniref:hypothetical protein n=1 Tax=Flavobacteriaceae TaxID=49546 RepID=UPI000800A570|nr:MULTISPECIES: hypothetical protein [Tamlana]OBQ56646.1 hypothetical protein VQ01_04710 [Tamlana sp. s12]QQY81713.1 hypothetical protein JJL45_12370 [Tamlana sp. s12]
MKKLLFTSIFGLFALISMNAQTFKVGGSVGVPLSDASDFSSVVVGADVYYYFTNIDQFISIGGNVGFRNFFGKEYDGVLNLESEDSLFLPVAGAARVKLFGLFSGGVDLGYAFGLSDFLDGGFYVKPVVSVDVADIIEVFVSYENISDYVNYGNLNCGVLFQF